MCGHTGNWDLLKESRKLEVWILDDFPMPDPLPEYRRTKREFDKVVLRLSRFGVKR